MECLGDNMDKPISIKILNSIFKFISFFLPVKKRVLFLGSPRNRTLMENGQMVYDELNCNKKVIVKELPHNIFDVMYISFFIMTSSSPELRRSQSSSSVIMSVTPSEQIRIRRPLSRFPRS